MIKISNRYFHLLLWGLILLTLALHIVPNVGLSDALYELGLTLRSHNWVREGTPPLSFWILKLLSPSGEITDAHLWFLILMPIGFQLILLSSLSSSIRFWALSIYLSSLPLTQWALNEPNLNIAASTYLAFLFLYSSVRQGKWNRLFIPSLLLALILFIFGTTRIYLIVSSLSILLFDVAFLTIKNRKTRLTILLFLTSGFLLSVPLFALWFIFSDGVQTLAHQWSSLPYRFLFSSIHLQHLFLISPIAIISALGLLQMPDRKFWFAAIIFPFVLTIALQSPLEEVLLLLLPILCIASAYAFSLLTAQYETALFKILSLVFVYGILIISLLSPKPPRPLFSRIKQSCDLELLDEIILDANLPEANALYLRLKWELMERIRPVEVIPPGYPGQLLIRGAQSSIEQSGWNKVPLIREKDFTVFVPIKSTACQTGY